MLYCISDAKYPVEYVSSGILDSESGFVHPTRNIDTFVLIVGIQGELNIIQDGMPEYSVGPNEFLILFPNRNHTSSKPSSGKLRYYWVHFYINDPDYRIHNQGALKRSNLDISADFVKNSAHDNHYVLPACGKLDNVNKVTPIFRQLLDMAKRENYRVTWRSHYLLSYILLEVSHESMLSNVIAEKKIPEIVVSIMEWIRTHYAGPITVDQIGKIFGYTPSYLEVVFKGSTNYSIISYINSLRIDVSKNLLTNPRLSIQTIAGLCGYNDSKYFMKTFKKYVGMTPSQYRKTIYLKKANRS
ncbi:AraC family transcriptional regulator [Lachnoclostridium sp. Marseille-P6806]|uniref:AraC family transcriptional regulator n=1 Tax=Lachnoclostridium sp. Marseille-P6806 TaxID=2364793 RepID=UPI001031E9C9|nr:AraC family transcriptional regulator [Lachnoclostridium sp. Marseille-P6806]